MSAGWREFLGEPNSLPGGGGMMPAFPGNPYGHPGAPESPLTRVEDLSVWLDRTRVDRAVLSFGLGGLAPAHPNHYLALELVRAANRWSSDRWLSCPDERIFGLVLVPNQLPDEAATELRRAGRHSRVVGALMCGNGLGKPFGHPLYHAIYEAAADLDLPIVIRAGGDVPPDTESAPTAGGLPSLYTDYHALSGQALMTHVVSLIAEGVFEKFGGLRVMVVGGGVTWIPWLLWRFDNEYKAFRREAPWLRAMPSEYFSEHIWVGTAPIERGPRAEAVRTVLGITESLRSVLCYASGYPRWDVTMPEDLFGRIPDDWMPDVLDANAKRLFRWPTDARSSQRSKQSPRRLGLR
jgi:uncharacterized protein